MPTVCVCVCARMNANLRAPHATEACTSDRSRFCESVVNMVSSRETNFSCGCSVLSARRGVFLHRQKNLDVSHESKERDGD